MSKITFGSKYPEYKAVMEAGEFGVKENKTIQFENGQYTTEDPKEIEFLKKLVERKNNPFRRIVILDEEANISTAGTPGTNPEVNQAKEEMVEETIDLEQFVEKFAKLNKEGEKSGWYEINKNNYQRKEAIDYLAGLSDEEFNKLAE